jgi:hypothetical protein
MLSSAADAADITVTYSEEEASAAVSLYDLAVKAGGLSVAQNALVLTQKLQAAASAARSKAIAAPVPNQDRDAQKKP